jgi:hypothetical protein
VTTAKLIVPYLDKVAAITATTLDGFRALRPPAGQSSAASKLIAAQQARLDDLHNALGAAASHDGAGFTAAIQKDQRQDSPRYVIAAAALGLRTCAAGH